MAKKWKRIVIHHSASTFGTAGVIDDWHRARGWSGNGYHFVIQNGYPDSQSAKDQTRWEFLDGEIEQGRRMDLDDTFEPWESGAHVKGKNSQSIGICIIKDNDLPATDKQIKALYRTLRFLLDKFNLTVKDVYAHSDFDPAKPDCPGTEVMTKIRAMLTEKPKPELYGPPRPPQDYSAGTPAVIVGAGPLSIGNGDIIS